MAPRRAAAAAAEVEEAEPQLPGLQFNEPLTWRAGKAIPVGDLLRRLDTLSKELRDMEQESIDVNSLTKVAKELASTNLITHKDRGIRAFTACCLVDILRICAPDAPFTPAQLKDIFTLFVTSILPSLGDPSDAYNTQHMYVLNSFVEVKSILLILDVSGSDALVLHLFTSLFDIISGSTKAKGGEQISKGVEYNMTQILVYLVDEAQSLPTDVIDIIVAQFLRAVVSSVGKGKKDQGADGKQTKLVLKEFPPAYHMAKTICNHTPDKMSRYISQYFNDVIIEATPGRNGTREDARSDDEDANTGPSEEDIAELNKAHVLLRELWRASPAVLQNVIPQLEAELSADNVSLRQLATETLGDIVSGIGAAGPPSPPLMDPAAYPPANLTGFVEPDPNASILTTPMSPQSFAQTHPSVYNSFLGRKNDKSPVIRSAWTTAIGRILTTSAGGIGLGREDEQLLVKSLAEKLNDSDEKVRLSAVKAVSTFSFRDIMSKLAISGDVTKSGSVLCSLADRARDRRHGVRVEAMTTLARIWGVAAGEIAAENEAVVSLLGAIPSKVFDAYYTNDLDINVLLDRVMFEELIPLSFPPSKSKAFKSQNGDSQGNHNGDSALDPDKIRTQRILLLVRSLDPKSKKAFFAMLARQKPFSDVIASFMNRCEEFNGGVIEDHDEAVVKQKITSIIAWLSGFLPDPPRVSSDLWKYAKLHDRRTYHLIRLAISSETEFSTVYKALKEVFKRIEAAPGAPAGLLDTLTPLLYRSSSLVYNRSHLPSILQYASNDEDGLSEVAHEVLNQISEKTPNVFKSHIKDLCKQIEEQAPNSTKENGPETFKTLKACAAFAVKYPKEVPRDKKFVAALGNFAQYGTPPKAAKYAVTILMASTDRKEMHARDLLRKATSLWTYGEDHFLSRLATISQVTLLEPKMADEQWDEILDITTQQILLKVRTAAQEGESRWQEDSAVDEECQAKSWALKILVNRLRHLEDIEEAKLLSEPVFKVLNALITNEGELSKKKDTPAPHKSRLRLLAAQLHLKLCTRGLFDELFTAVDFNRLATVAQDSLFQVRRDFIFKLQKYLVNDRLSSRFNTIIFLVAFEPDAELRAGITTWIRSRVRYFQTKPGGKQSIIMEMAMARLLSLLAHHPDYSPEVQDLIDHARYILFYVSAVVTPENLGLVYKFAERVKQAQDGIDPSKSDNLYILSDLATLIIRKWQEKKGWTMQTFPGKVRMPAGLFKALPSHEVAQKIADKNYLPEGVEDGVDVLIKEMEKRKHKRKSSFDGQNGPSKKIKSEKRTSTKKVAKPKTPAKKKKDKDEFSTPRTVVSDADRRKSGRSASARKSTTYADRDSDEDDEEMLDGVAEWEYLDGQDAEDDDESSSQDEEVEEAENDEPLKDKTKDKEEESELSEPEEEPEARAEPEIEIDEAEEEQEEEEEEPEPEPVKKSLPRRGGRKEKPATPPPKNKAKGKAKETVKQAEEPKTRSTRSARSR